MNKIKRFVFIALASIMMLGTALPAYASGGGDSDVETVQNYVNENGLKQNVKKYLTEDMPENGGGEYIEYNGKNYYFKDNDAKTNAAKAVTKSNNSDKKIDELDSTVDELVNPDTGTATTILGGFSGIINTFLGIMIVLITLFMTVFTALDICYIVFPAVRGWLDNSYQSGGVNAKKNADGSTSMRLITDEAQYAVKQFDMGANGQGGGGNPMTTYFKKRVLNYLVLSIMLFILLTGNITLLTNLAINVVSGILEVLTSI